MGGFNKERNHLRNLFPQCFFRALPRRDMRFQRVQVDLMQYIVGLVMWSNKGGGGGHFASQSLANKVRQTVEYYLHTEEYVLEETLLILLDSPESVPALKGVTQRSRDQESSPVLGEAAYEAYISRRDIDEENHLLINEGTTVPFEGATIRRSVNLRLQHDRVISHTMTQIKVPEGLVLVLDDGFLVEEDHYAATRNTMVANHNFHAHSYYAKECLVSTLCRYHMTQRLFIYPDGHFTRRETTRSGEADIKVCRYITRERHRYLVVSQDTDSIFILLLHLKTLLDPETGELDEALELWLDMRRPQDEAKDLSHNYRFIDIKALYRAILALFAREYPEVTHPVETLVLLVYALRTDYMSPYHTYLEIWPSLVWNAFSELHCASAEGHLLFDGVAREDEVGAPKRETAHKLPRELRNVLAGAVQCVYVESEDAYRITLDQDCCQRFFYLLCELRVRRDLVLIGYEAYAHRYILDADELFTKVAELEEKIAQCRREGHQAVQQVEERSRQAFLSLLEEEKRAALEVARGERQLSATLPPPTSPAFDFESTGNILANGKGGGVGGVLNAKLRELAEREVPPGYGIPRVQAMLARIYRIEWMLNYHQNGWISPRYVMNFDEPSEHNYQLSKHGWKTREIAQTPESVARGEWNNAYNTFRYQHRVQAGLIPFRVYETVESDEVCNRQYVQNLFAQ